MEADDEDKLLRSVALQNAHSILQARQRAEQELIATKEALHQSNEQVTSILESITDGFVVLNHEWRFAYLNQRAAEILGPLQQSEGSLLGRTIWQEFPGLQGTIVEENCRRAMRDGTTVEFESHDARLNGWLEIRAYPGRDGLSIYFQDITQRKQAEDEVRQQREWRDRANQQFRLAIEAAPTGMLMVDSMGKIVLVNAQIEKLFGYQREELIGKPIEMLVPARFGGRHPTYRTGFFHSPKTRPMGGGRELHGLRKDGTEVPVEIGLNPLQTPEGDFVLSSVADITERKRAEREREDLMGQLKLFNSELEERVRVRTSELTASLKEREVLLQEVHHRVKNNLQVISSMINMQMRKLDNGTSREALEECQTRVQAIALIHEKLYQSKDYARVPFFEYVRSLAGNVFHASGILQSAVSLDLAIDEVTLTVDKAIPCGLIVNELMTNAFKHAFPDNRIGTIRVELRRLDGARLRLVVADDGIGMPPGSDINNSDSLGIQLVCTLAEQLDAELRVDNDAGKGTSFHLTFAAEG